MKKETASTKSVQEFRDAVAANLGAGSGVLLNLIDALATGPRPDSPVELTLSTLFAYDWSSLYQTLRRAEEQLAETIYEDVDFHRELIRDHNRLPHWAHRFRQDQKRAPLEVLGAAQGKAVEPAGLQRAFGQHYCQRRIDEQGFVRLGRGKIYIEEGLPKTPVQLPYWDGKLRAEYGEYQLMEYQCHWGKERFPADGVKQSCSSRPLLFKANKRSCLTSCDYVTRLFRANLYR